MAEPAAQKINIDELRNFWVRNTSGAASDENPADVWVCDQTLLSGLRLNILETHRFLRHANPSYKQFEAWIVETNGGAMNESELNRLHQALAGEAVGSEHGSLAEVEGLSEADLTHWDEHGYVVLKHAVSKQDAKAAEMAVYEFLEMD